MNSFVKKKNKRSGIKQSTLLNSICPIFFYAGKTHHFFQKLPVEH